MVFRRFALYRQLYYSEPIMRRSLMFGFVLMLLVSVMGVQGQTREDDIPYLTFAVTEGRSDNYHYPSVVTSALVWS